MKFLKKSLKWAGIAVIVLFVLAQLGQPARTNPPAKTDFVAATKAPPQIAALFHAACYDCHSDETRWPWYSYVAPISWQVAQDVVHGRKHVNLSEWPADRPDLAQKKLDDMSDAIDDGDMPLRKYTWIHKDARLTKEQRKEMTQWLDAKSDAMNAQTGED